VKELDIDNDNEEASSVPNTGDDIDDVLEMALSNIAVEILVVLGIDDEENDEYKAEVERLKSLEYDTEVDEKLAEESDPKEFVESVDTVFVGSDKL
jgi:hypothetical protein